MVLWNISHCIYFHTALQVDLQSTKVGVSEWLGGFAVIYQPNLFSAPETWVPGLNFYCIKLFFLFSCFFSINNENYFLKWIFIWNKHRKELCDESKEIQKNTRSNVSPTELTAEEIRVQMSLWLKSNTCLRNFPQAKII